LCLVNHFIWNVARCFWEPVVSAVAMHDYDTICRRTVFRNADKRKTVSQSGISTSSSGAGGGGGGTAAQVGSASPGRGNSKVIQKASSFTMDFECTALPFHMVQLNGRY
jgi:hypothetical protein